MRQLERRQAALSRDVVPPFLILGGLEELQLRKLPGLCRCVFVQLVALSSFSSGRVVTSWAVLLSLLDFDVDPCNRADRAPSLQQVRTAVDRLVDCGLVGVNTKRNRKVARLIFHIEAREGIIAAELGRNRGRNRVATPGKPRQLSLAYKKPDGAQQGGATGGARDTRTPPPPVSTGDTTRTPAEARALMAELADRMRLPLKG